MSDTAPGDIGVLEATPPRFTPAEVAAIARELFGIDGEARELGSERDQAFMVDDGSAGGVVKISNLGEDPAVLDLENEAILHIRRADPDLPVARPQVALGASDAADPASYRPTTEGPDGRHFVRLFERMPGRAAAPGSDLDDQALFAYGRTLARLGMALRGFFHPQAGRTFLWDTKNALGLRPLVPSIPDERNRRMVEGLLDRYERNVTPVWPRLRSQVIHGDFALDNALLDDRDRVVGIIDFGDIVHSALATDLASSLSSVLRTRDEDDVFRSGRILIDGFESLVPLEPIERRLLADLLGARLCTIVSISAFRVLSYPENAEYIQAWDPGSWMLINLFDRVGMDEVAHEFGAERPHVPSAELARRRRQALGSAITALTYSEPVHVERGEGPWLFDADGRRLLDVYNNVPVVGHCHPRVTEAVVRQTRTLNTHSRYLYEPLVDLAERLIAAMPDGSGLDTAVLVNSGSEANDLAWRIATAVTGGNGALITDFAYHGVTTVIAAISPEEWPAGYRPDNVETVKVADTTRLGAETDEAIGRLRSRWVEPAAAYLDGGFTSDGVRTPTAADVAAMVDRWRAAGGLFVADEVQAGHGRTGDHMWSFQGFGIAPDFVTLGKPMGNGYPVAALITRSDLMDRFAETTDFFSTFGGNPVAARAAIAVLDVIRDERLMENAATVGEALRARLRDVASRHAVLGDVRGRGLLIGVDVVDADGAPDEAAARRIVDGLRQRGVLVGRTGPHSNVLKIRPPLVFRDEHAMLMADTLAAVLEES
jgi:4-aminobutyrate aminotransferase-like enzyme